MTVQTSAERLEQIKRLSKQEPFDFVRLSALCNTCTPKENESDTLEVLYYISHPEIKTLAEFAKLVDEMEIGDGN